MVYQIYYLKGDTRQVLFDIEMYLEETDKKEWRVEMHSISFISGVVEFLKDKFIQDATVSDKVEDLFDWKQFKKDCDDLEELRGWLWETHSNRPRTIDEASDDKSEWGKYVKKKVDEFANKYGLYVNED